MMETILQDKRIVLGVTGGIAAYKAADLASKLTQAGAVVKTIMSKNATHFVGPLTFKALTGQPVVTDLFASGSHGFIEHVSLAYEADLVVVAPATANILAKAAHGIADDALSTTLLAAEGPIVMVPAMNNHMWDNPATQANLLTLQERGVNILAPEVGRLACGSEEAMGRFPKTETVLEYLKDLFNAADILAGKTIIVTAGGTHEPIDAVRFIGNRSSGKMGYAIAGRAKACGAEVILISGPTGLRAPAGVRLIEVETALEMRRAVIDNLPGSAALIMAAAVADFRVAGKVNGKIKKERMDDGIALELNPDILQEVAGHKDRGLIIGFAAESENIIAHAILKLEKKKLDLIVANDIGRSDAGFGSDYNLAVLIDHDGPQGELAMYRKSDLASEIINWLARALGNNLCS
ncbi:MAG: bifunctional phosphopantothenoylcysteine decarboxylase/phosphopantothenate--cysteine ligase CoaBC [Actinomycetota bacterium]|nr:bifunctional phosphopantothenoylcysteine decarboxylase/phosphopantothenate--cysteine ligase CoaBC [Actinomycetota bacterium]